MKRVNDREWDYLAILMLLAVMALSAPKKSNTSSPGERPYVPNITIESTKTRELQTFDTYDDETEEIVNNDEESQSTLINLPPIVNRASMFEEPMGIDTIYVFDTNKGEITSINEGDDKVTDRVTYDIDCQSGEEIMPFNIFLDVGSYEDFMHDAYVLPLINKEGVVYQTNDFKTAFRLRGLQMVPLKEFLEYNGLEDEIRDTYIYDDVAALYYKFNRAIEVKKITLEQ